MGAWLSLYGTTVTGAVLTATEFRDFSCARYNVNPPNIQNKCNGCMKNFLMRHVLIFPTRGLVIARHN